MFYKLIDEKTVEKASNPLCIDGKHIFTNSKEVFNENGFYKLVNTEYPQDDKYYESKYVLQDNIIVQTWVENAWDEITEEEYLQVIEEQGGD